MTAYEQLKSLALSLEEKVFENEPMSRHTTFKIGGPADIYIAPSSAAVLKKICAFCACSEIPYFAVGNGSNLLVSDKGIREVVISTANVRGISRDGGAITCGSGEQLSYVCEFARREGLSGLEFAFGIPGTVGGAVYMNAGAYGGEMKDVVAASSHIKGGESGGFLAQELAFGYRHSVYSSTDMIITQVTFKLEQGDISAITERMHELIERRKTKQPLEWPSAGSVFKRPPGNYAGTLIESCGLKGMRVGGAAVSEKHAGFIINTGGATCGDVLNLIDKIKTEVFRQTGVMLECEIRMAGEE
jgi:UDP-N-acetylmuramate dehydrogenase